MHLGPCTLNFFLWIKPFHNLKCIIDPDAVAIAAQLHDIPPHCVPEIIVDA